MTRLGCQGIVPSRAKRGEDTTCGREGQVCRLTGGIASVGTTLCAKHWRAFAKEGFSIGAPGIRAPRIVAGEAMSAIVDYENGPTVDDLPFQKPDQIQVILDTRRDDSEGSEAPPNSATKIDGKSHNASETQFAATQATGQTQHNNEHSEIRNEG
jgi:hypothetical protein